MKKTVTEKLSEIAKMIKGQFEDSEIVADASTEEGGDTAKFVEVSTVDGETTLSYDGELAEGTAIFIVDAESGEQVPAPEGTYELSGEMAGTTLVLDADGIVSELITAEVEEAPETEDEAMSSEDVESIVDSKLSGLDSPLDAIAKGIEAILSENASLKSELAEFKEEFAAFKDSPDEKEEKKKFSRNDKPLSAAEMRTATMARNRKAKK